MFGISGWEVLLIAGIALMLFGPDKLPRFARTIGRMLRDFKRYQDLMESTLRAEMYSMDNPLASDTFKKGKEFRERVQSGEFEPRGADAGGSDGSPGDADAGIGVNEDLNLGEVDSSDLGRVPGRDVPGEEGENEARPPAAP